MFMSMNVGRLRNNIQKLSDQHENANMDEWYYTKR